jgi:hypothetical protein
MNKTVLRSLGVAFLGGAGVLVSVVLDPAHALLAWIAAYGFGLSTVLGALLLVMFFHVTNARWPVVLRPLLMGITATTPLFALLFVPIAFGMSAVYPWVQPMRELGELNEHQRAWNNVGFFLARAVVYLLSWVVLAMALTRADTAYARTPTVEGLARLRRISAGGILVVAFTLTFASFDWLMALQPGWISNMYGLYVFAGGLSAAIALVAVLAWRGRRSGALPTSVGPSHFLALGRLMLMSVVFWAYIAFFQLMLIWIANLPHEVSFYIARSRGSFGPLSMVLLFGHFVLPFLLLLSRPLKSHAPLLGAVGAWILLMNAVDFAWLVLPAGGGHLRWLDVAPFLVVSGLGAAYGALGVSRLRERSERMDQGSSRGRSPRSPLEGGEASTDPALAESLRYRSP